jgi:hypothetical protein
VPNCWTGSDEMPMPVCRRPARINYCADRPGSRKADVAGAHRDTDPSSGPGAVLRRLIHTAFIPVSSASTLVSRYMRRLPPRLRRSRQGGSKRATPAGETTRHR